MRPKSCGLSTHSATMLPSSSSSCANTVTSPVVRSITTRASSAWACDRLYALANALSRASMTVSNAIPFSRSMLRNASISTFIAPLSSPWQRLRRLLDVGVGDRYAITLDVEHDLLVGGLHHSPLHLVHGVFLTPTDR